VALIHAMAGSADPALARHAATLLGPRTRGSTTERGLDAVAPEAPLTEITAELEPAVQSPGCRYFTFAADGLGARLGAISHWRAVAMYGRTAIKRRQGEHGPELYVQPAAGKPALEEVRACCRYCAVVLGPAGEYPEFADGVIDTWHPGPPLAVLQEGQEPTDATGVKLQAGSQACGRGKEECAPEGARFSLAVGNKS
jgi:hypothetical protein